LDVLLGAATGNGRAPGDLIPQLREQITALET
jgi:hypothetical protein